MTDFGVVLLTMGNRPEELNRALNSLALQRNVTMDIVCVGNGWKPTGLPSYVKTEYLPKNLGVCGGRNAGVARVAGELLFFLDDDAWLSDPDFLATSLARFRAWPGLGIVQPHVHDPDSPTDARRWIPRLRKGDPTRSSYAFTLWEGALIVRRKVFDDIGGFGDELFFYHEGIELAWRCWDQGSVAWYAGDLVAHHPNTPPARHIDNDFHRLMARNRVWIARRNLPTFIAPIYVGSWTAVQLIRSRSDRAGLSIWLQGWRDGWRSNPGPKRPMRLRTVWEMTRRGRAPII
jgi:GT2 family glycosyltransferase